MSTDLVFGYHAVRGALRREPDQVVAVWLDRQRRDKRSRELMGLAAGAGVAVSWVTRAEMDALAGDAVHQGMLARVQVRAAQREPDLDDLLDRLQIPPLLLALDGVTDPHNLGACLRSADAAGVHAVIAPRDRAAGLSPVVRKVASGATETVPFVQVTNLARTLDALRRRGIWVLGAAGEAEAAHFDADMSGALALVLGAEGEGLRRLTRERCDQLIAIPMQGQVQSLNVSVAAGVLLFEALRQRRSP
jgi:23S rRNA (guanosine2251-2'-O)-methyltransferase